MTHNVTLIIAHWFMVLVGACSVLTLVLSVIDKWAQQWFPHSKFAFVVTATTDLVSKFGALNLREQIAPKQWDGQDRRGDTNSDTAQAGGGK